MQQIQALSRIINDFFLKSKIEKPLSILTELRSGKYPNASAKRTFLVDNYKYYVYQLNESEYSLFKDIIINSIRPIIEERSLKSISYTLMAEIIEYSCKDNFDILFKYEDVVINLCHKNKEKHLYQVFTLANIRNKLIGDITSIEDFYIKHYLCLTRTNTITTKYLFDFTINVMKCDKVKILKYLFSCRPFKNDYILRSFILQNDELKRFASLV